MGYQTPTFAGDDIYNVNCTGDAVTGDEVRFERATFSGSFRNAKFAGFERITGKIINDSYGRDKQQHTFTIELETGEKLMIKGRNLYKEALYRKAWGEASLRHEVADEKHARGDMARTERNIRKMESHYHV
jgi:hypothetical protein